VRTPPLYDELARRGMKAFDNSMNNGICGNLIVENDACRTQSEGNKPSDQFIRRRDMRIILQEDEVSAARIRNTALGMELINYN
jgi:hypothetical protein